MRRPKHQLLIVCVFGGGVNWEEMGYRALLQIRK